MQPAQGDSCCGKRSSEAFPAGIFYRALPEDLPFGTHGRAHQVLWKSLPRRTPILSCSPAPCCRASFRKRASAPGVPSRQAISPPNSANKRGDSAVERANVALPPGESQRASNPVPQKHDAIRHGRPFPITRALPSLREFRRDSSWNSSPPLTSTIRNCSRLQHDTDEEMSSPAVREQRRKQPSQVLEDHDAPPGFSVPVAKIVEGL